MKKVLPLLTFILGTQLAGIVGSAFTAPAIDTWYLTLNKPFFNPPNWLFAPVWLMLYLLMAIAAFLVWQKKPKVTKALRLYVLQLLLNSLWSIFFFGLQIPWLAFLEIIILWVFILLTMLELKKTSRKAYWLMLPYLLWVSFASILNLAVAILN